MGGAHLGFNIHAPNPAAMAAIYLYLDKWPTCALLANPPGDSCTFRILPVSTSPQHVQIHCIQGTQSGKYIVVKPNMDVIAGSTSDGDTVFHRDNVPGGSETISLSYPAIVPTHYLAFDAASGEAQLEESPTNNRSYMQVIGGPFRKPNDGADVLEGMSAIDEVLTIDPPATMEPEASCKAEA